MVNIFFLHQKIIQNWYGFLISIERKIFQQFLLSGILRRENFDIEFKINNAPKEKISDHNNKNISKKQN